jgi:hypothetical protein
VWWQVSFGPDRVHRYCEVNDLQLIVRAHECVMDGFERFAAGKLITVFSATNYCGTANNAGAILVIGRDLVVVPKLIHPLPPSVRSPRTRPLTTPLSLSNALSSEDAPCDHHARCLLARVLSQRPSLFQTPSAQKTRPAITTRGVSSHASSHNAPLSFKRPQLRRRALRSPRAVSPRTRPLTTPLSLSNALISEDAPCGHHARCLLARVLSQRPSLFQTPSAQKTRPAITTRGVSSQVETMKPLA